MLHEKIKQDLKLHIKSGRVMLNAGTRDYLIEVIIQQRKVIESLSEKRKG